MLGWIERSPACGSALGAVNTITSPLAASAPPAIRATVDVVAKVLA
jgi:hypothetical protein